MKALNKGLVTTLELTAQELKNELESIANFQKKNGLKKS